MSRRLSTILVPAVAVLAASSLAAGCSTVDNDAAARVNDAELEPEELTELVEVLREGEVTNGDAVRSTLQIWILVEVAGAQFAADGAELTDDERATSEALLTDQLPGFADLGESTQNTLIDAQATLAAIDTLADGAAFVDLATSNADIYVNPRFGQFDPTIGVIPLAVAPSVVEPPAADPPAAG